MRYLLPLYLLFLFSQPALADRHLCGHAATPISKIQGPGMNSPLINQIVNVEAVVSAVFQQKSSLGGYFLLEDIADQDGNEQTSEGLFVFDQRPVKQGQRIQVTGKVTEYYGLTELTAVSRLISCSDQHSDSIILPVNIDITAPLEAYESMPVITDSLHITSHKNWYRFGELGIGPGHWPSDQPVELILDDNNNKRSVDHLASRESGRLNTQLSPFTAILGYRYGKYRLHPLEKIKAIQSDRPSLPVKPDQTELTLATFNVYNFFNGDGSGAGFPTSRGAQSYAAYQLQLKQLSETLVDIDADLVALTEIENDGRGPDSALADLVKAINEMLPSDQQYQMIQEVTGSPGSDAIRQDIIYRPARFNPTAAFYKSLAEQGRPALIVTGSANRFNTDIMVAVIHLKSRGSVCPEDTGPSQEGNCSSRRQRQMTSLVSQIPEFEGTSFIAGDLNSLPHENVLRIAKNAGWVDSRVLADKPKGFTYIFNDEPLALDYILINQKGNLKLIDHIDWHINSQEIRQAMQLEASSGKFGASDHDPVIIYLGSGAN